VKGRQQDKNLSWSCLWSRDKNLLWKCLWSHGTLKFQIAFWALRPTSTKDLKLEILICCYSLITEQYTPLHQTPHILPIPSLNWEIFAALEVLGVGAGLNNFLWSQRKSSRSKD
jgi:hypothetical protein